MLIDSFTVIAQLINFLLLVWLLKRFLYRPILRAIDAREQRLRDAQQQAEQQRQQATQLQHQLEHERTAFHEQQQTLAQARQQQAEQQAQQWLEEQRQQIDEQRRRWQQQLCQEQQAVHHQLTAHAQQALIDSLRQILQDLADQPLEQQLYQVFIHQLTHLDNTGRQQLAHALRSSQTGGSAVLLRSSFALSEEQQRELRQLLSEHWQCHDIGFCRDTTLICGLELVTDGHKVSWTLAQRLDELEQQLQQHLVHSPICNLPPQEHP